MHRANLRSTAPVSTRPPMLSSTSPPLTLSNLCSTATTMSRSAAPVTLMVSVHDQCDWIFEDMPVYAVVAGKEQAIQAAVSEETTKYQVSWQEEHENAHAATIKVDLFDEDGYSAYRKVTRWHSCSDCRSTPIDLGFRPSYNVSL